MNEKEQQPMLPTPDQWARWKQEPVAAWFFAALQKEFLAITEDFVMGGTINTGSVDETALATVQRQAHSKALYMIGQASYGDVCDMLDIELPIEEEEDDRGYSS